MWLVHGKVIELSVYVNLKKKIHKMLKVLSLLFFKSKPYTLLSSRHKSYLLFNMHEKIGNPQFSWQRIRLMTAHIYFAFF